MESVTLRQLEIFVYIAQFENMTAASKKLFLTQSAVSMSLKELEKTLGGSVFHRVGRGLILNDRGRALLPKAKNILASVKDLVDMAHNTEKALMGELMIGCSTTIGNYFFPTRLKLFCDEHPRVRITLNVGNTREIAKLVREGILDIGLVEGIVEERNLDEKEWVKDVLVVIASPEHPFACRSMVPMAEMIEEQWVLRERGSGTLSSFEALLASKNLRFPYVQEIGHTEAIKRVVEAGMGMSCLSRLAVEQELREGSLVEIPTDIEISRWFRIISLPEEHRSRLFNYMMKWLFSFASVK
jgi:DNA-binding transcriptional LysR family regulator